MSDDPGQGAHGFVTVPAEPTDPMCEAMLERVEEAEAGRGAPFKWPDVEHMFDIYTAAIAAAPRRSPAGMAPDVWNDSYQSKAIELAKLIQQERRGNFDPDYQDKLLLADALLRAVSSTDGTGK